jgi:hypothetical protein
MKFSHPTISATPNVYFLAICLIVLSRALKLILIITDIRFMEFFQNWSNEEAEPLVFTVLIVTLTPIAQKN